MTRFLAPLALAAALVASGIAAAAEPRTILERFSQGLEGLDGRFSQRVFDADGRLTEETGGRVALSAPRLFRWEYEAPFPQLIVADGDHVWVYDPDLEQVQVRKQSLEEQQSPLAALIDPAELERQFTVSAAASDGALDWIVLTPKDDEAQIESARLAFEGVELRRMTMADALGQRTEIRFENWQRNPAFARGTFVFVPGPGVDVIGEIAEGAEVYRIPD
jgi:outer membrane lipoprotein carrier protein